MIVLLCFLCSVFVLCCSVVCSCRLVSMSVSLYGLFRSRFSAEKQFLLVFSICLFQFYVLLLFPFFQFS